MFCPDGLVLSLLLEFFNRLHAADICLEVDSREFYCFSRSAVCDASQSTYGSQNLYLWSEIINFPTERGETHTWINQVLIFVQSVFPDPKPRPLKHNQRPTLPTRIRPTIILPQKVQLRLNTHHRLLYPRAFNRLAIILRRQPTDIPLRDTIGCICASRVGGLDKPFRDNVHDTLLAVNQVPERILRLVHPAGDAEGEEWGIVVHYVEVAEWC